MGYATDQDRIDNEKMEGGSKMKFYEEVTKEMAQKMIEDGSERLLRSAIETEVINQAKMLERGADGGYRFPKPNKKKKHLQCPHCKYAVVNLPRHVKRHHVVEDQEVGS